MDISVVESTRNHTRLSRQRKYWSCGHYSSVTNAYRNLGEIVLDPKKLTLQQFNSQMVERDVQDLATTHLNKWKNATKVVFPVVRIHVRDVQVGAYVYYVECLEYIQANNRTRIQIHLSGGKLFFSCLIVC